MFAKAISLPKKVWLKGSGVAASAAAAASAGISGPGAVLEGGNSMELGPGGLVLVNGRRYTVVKQIGEGGYSLVYLVTDGSQQYALKRMFALAEDPEQVARLRLEVDLLRELRHENIVRIIDIQDGSRSGGGSYCSEVLILMEFCTGGSLADVVIERMLSRRFFSETDILRIFLPICRAVSALHLRQPPTFHRDLKVENVLICEGAGGTKCYKLCDFGSATTQVLIPRKEDRARIEEEISRVTTPVFQSPEMADVYRGQPIDDKADIWALGCLLYKLAYLALPFNEGERLGILNGRYTIPSSPPFEAIPTLIRSLLRDDPADRPDISQLINEVESTLHLPRSDLPSVHRQQSSKPSIPQQSAEAVLSSLEWIGEESDSDVGKTHLKDPPPPTPLPTDSATQRNGPSTITPKAAAPGLDSLIDFSILTSPVPKPEIGKPDPFLLGTTLAPTSFAAQSTPAAQPTPFLPLPSQPGPSQHFFNSNPSATIASSTTHPFAPSIQPSLRLSSGNVTIPARSPAFALESSGQTSIPVQPGFSTQPAIPLAPQLQPQMFHTLVPTSPLVHPHSNTGNNPPLLGLQFGISPSPAPTASPVLTHPGIVSPLPSFQRAGGAELPGPMSSGAFGSLGSPFASGQEQAQRRGGSTAAAGLFETDDRFA